MKALDSIKEIPVNNPKSLVVRPIRPIAAVTAVVGAEQAPLLTQDEGVHDRGRGTLE